MNGFILSRFAPRNETAFAGSMPEFLKAFPLSAGPGMGKAPPRRAGEWLSAASAGGAAGRAEIAAVLADDCVVAAFRAALAGVDIHGASAPCCIGSRRLAVEAHGAHRLYRVPTLVENAEHGMPMDQQPRQIRDRGGVVG